MADHDNQIPATADSPGYHLAVIARGEFGEASKIREEFEEFLDAEQQGVRLMALVELSDLLGAVEGYLGRHHPATTVADLRKAAVAIRRSHGRDGREWPGGTGAIRQCVDAFIAADIQDARPLAVNELAHLLAAMESYLAARHQGTTMECLARMSAVTQRAFRSGRRTPQTAAQSADTCEHHPA